ncbi:MAG: flagellar assembly peptidoglycan hydrolase FlgJ [Pseudolabrys sp.]|nr:flagellar assembly peptidoglycan hydrolase FlgJ [Pseudolabrys sp.]MDP2295165.1 flagellar assembly peptidoglycan hydrolase FlgJ [Pseudolabrys sp.]
MASTSSSMALPAPGLNAMDLLKNNPAAAAQFKATVGGSLSEAGKAKAKAAAQDFEAVFLNSMLQQMFTGLEGDGPMGGSGATGIWRSFLTDEYAKGFAKAGGIGIADQVYGALLAQQEART